jgi:hypothetical protein
VEQSVRTSETRQFAEQLLPSIPLSSVSELGLSNTP